MSVHQYGLILMKEMRACFLLANWLCVFIRVGLHLELLVSKARNHVLCRWSVVVHWLATLNLTSNCVMWSVTLRTELWMLCPWSSVFLEPWSSRVWRDHPFLGIVHCAIIEPDLLFISRQRSLLLLKYLVSLLNPNKANTHTHTQHSVTSPY